MTRSILFIRGFVFIAVLIAGLSANAHESRPVYIDLKQQQPTIWQLQWKTPASIPYANSPEITLQGNCQPQQQRPAQIIGADGRIQRLNYRCETGLSGQALTILYPGANPSVSALVRYQTLKGEKYIQLLSPEQRSWIIPREETAPSVAWNYTVLGMEHIWGGIDHLLFVICLLWIAGTGKRILVTITGFTLAHSVTLVLSALNLVRLPIPPVEAVIALSIVFLATEIAKGRRDSLTWRYPIAVSVSFGLLHGFGFASALSEIGLPQTERMVGLLFFNLGVEIGQVLFAAVAIVLVFVARKVLRHRYEAQSFNNLARIAMSYFVGTVASYWMVERIVAFV